MGYVIIIIMGNNNNENDNLSDIDNENVGLISTPYSIHDPQRLPAKPLSELKRALNVFLKTFETCFDTSRSLEVSGLTRNEFSRAIKHSKNFSKQFNDVRRYILNRAEDKIMSLINEPNWITNTDGTIEPNPLAKISYDAAKFALESANAVSMGWSNSGTTIRVESEEKQKVKPIQIEVIKSLPNS